MSVNAAFSENSSKAILDMLVSIHSEMQVMKEQIGLILSNGNPNTLASIQEGSIERYRYYSQRLRNLLYEHYGDLDIDDLLR